MNKTFFRTMSLLLVVLYTTTVSAQTYRIELAGTWSFRVDPADKGAEEQWYRRKLEETISLPGSMTTNGKGNDISVNTPWTGSIFDSSWFVKPEYAAYRQPGNIKVPFWLQPVKYYKGAAWYQKTVDIPSTWKARHIELFIERSHWETTVWIDDRLAGVANSLGTPHVFDLSKTLTPGAHQITIRIDNRVKVIEVGKNSHSISDHTQSNWNGMVGKLFIAARPALYIDDVQLFPDIQNKQVTARIKINNEVKSANKAEIRLLATGTDKAEQLKPLIKQIALQSGVNAVEIVYPMGSRPLLWDEFNPNLYSLEVQLKNGKETDVRTVSFGMREFAAKGTQFTINGRLTFLRGTLECAIFPETGYPPTDVESWMRIFRIAGSYGLNHMRFHSWCPPEAAFDAADRLGFYLHVEASSWANQGATIGDGKPLDKYIYDETERMLREYGNHPSFCMLAYGNEPAGEKHVKYLTDYVNYWKKKDHRRLYTTAGGWPVIPENDFNSTPDPRIQGWGQGLKSIINGQAPKSNYDWSDIISKWDQPTVSHEIGQWCVYPDFKEIKRYSGVLKAKNFEIFQQSLKDHGMAHLADSFLMASGKLQALCYKAEIEAALRTPGFAGFQLLDLHDFPGQGTALVGVLNPFWEDKGYTTGKAFSRFCNATVPLARFPKMVYRNNEILSVPVEIAHFGATPLQNIFPSWEIRDISGETLFKGQLPPTSIPLGNGIQLGEITQVLSEVRQPQQLELIVFVGDNQNSWDFFVYPSPVLQNDEGILVTQQLDENALATLNKGGKVLLTLKQGSVRPEKGGSVAIGFSSIFWNTAWTGGQPPHTLGVLCNPAHPALAAFPTSYHSNWQWWDAMSHSNAVMLDSVANGLEPIVRIIDDWVTNRSLGLIFECRTGGGRLIVSSIDLLEQQQARPEAYQLLFSLKEYMRSEAFAPSQEADIRAIRSLIK
ncbi:MAG TPA: glycoside hydrolase family 2 TIM barrel-domain containing protein [Agriterribacter sp.]|nr:glycoside hydrolase family 2 TIM barrel-domain containing protein [Agriterribacter sp.]